MTAGGYSRKPGDDGKDSMAYKYSNADLDKFFDTPPIKEFIYVRFLKYIVHIVRHENTHPTERALFIQPDHLTADTVWCKVQFILWKYEIHLEWEDLIVKISVKSTLPSRG